MPQERYFCIDIGGSHIKGSILNHHGDMVEDYIKEPTPKKATPANVLKAIKKLASHFSNYTKISVGFPGYVKEVVIITAPNLGTKAWNGTNLSQKIGTLLKKPCRVVNDADMQGLGIASGKGLEIVVTLGTGFGTALLHNGTLLPHIELSHHPIAKDKIYDAYIGEAVLEKIGKAKWNKRIAKVIEVLKVVFNYDHLYLGGGNAEKISFKLDNNITIVNNQDGIKGGAKLWEDS